jgi:radical SAM protein with 4Fe4S-binding SPASM domain
MTEETAAKIGDYINAYGPTDRAINCHFFGGEPLYNQGVIDIIINKMIDYGRPFTTTFTTNGYLFTKDLINKAKTLWNTVDVQITIDGTESVYNKTKNYIYKDADSPYKRVLNNIAALLNRGISVTIRLNIDNYNAEDIKKLITELHNRFGNHPSLTMYAWPIFEDENFSRTKEEHIEVFKRLAEIENLLEQYDYTWGLFPSNEIASVQCMADDGTSVMIDPEGNIGTCEHLINSNFYSHIDNPLEKNFEELNKWRVYNEPLNICADCPLYPSCIRPTYCQEMGKCDEQYKEWRIRRHTFGMIQFYKRNKYPNNNMPRRLSENV